MYRLAIKEKLDKKFRKLQKKDKEMLQLIERKVQDILEDPYLVAIFFALFIDSINATPQGP